MERNYSYSIRVSETNLEILNRLIAEYKELLKSELKDRGLRKITYNDVLDEILRNSSLLQDAERAMLAGRSRIYALAKSQRTKLLAKMDKQRIAEKKTTPRRK